MILPSAYAYGSDEAIAYVTSRDAVLDGCIASAEFNTICGEFGIDAIFTQEELVNGFVERMYTKALGRAAEDIEFWATAAAQNRRAVLIGFTESQEFATLCGSYEIIVGTIQ